MSKESPYSDQELLRAVLENKASGWELFCAHFDPLIQSIAGWRKWCFSESEKQDVCQNIYIQLQKALPQFRHEGSLTRFIKVIAMRQCVNEIRRQVRWRKTMVPIIQETSDGEWNEMEFRNPDALDPHDMVLQIERRKAVNCAMQNLQDTCKNSITLFYVQDLSYKEISAQLGISINTVGSRLTKCLNKLNEELRKHPLFKRTQP
jgi:RNA polymerase sigma factor (sigma-70 family)